MHINNLLIQLKDIDIIAIVCYCMNNIVPFIVLLQIYSLNYYSKVLLLQYVKA